MANDVTVKVRADTNELTTGLNNASNAVNSFGMKAETLNRVGASIEKTFTNASRTIKEGLHAAMAPLLALASFEGLKNIVEGFARIEKLSQRFGESAESIQRVKFAAEQTGVEFEMVVRGLSKAEVNASKARDGNQALADSFAILGINTENFLKLSLEEKLTALVTGFKSAKDHGEAAAAVVAVMGRNAMEMGQLFEKGGAGVKALMEEATVASSATVRKIDEVADKIKAAFTALKVSAAYSIGFIINIIEEASAALGYMYAYIVNLPKGFKAAEQAAKDYMKAWGEIKNKGAREEEEKKNNKGEHDNALANVEDESAGKGKGKDKPEYYRMNGDKVTDLEGDSENMQSYKAKKKSDEILAENKKKRDMATWEAQQKENERIDGYSATMGKAIKKSEKEKEKEDHKNKIKDAKNDEDVAKVTLDSLKGKEGANKVSSDQLRKIGGGFAKSDYAGLGKEEMRLQKQIDIAQRSYDRLKDIVDALKNTDSTDGVTD